MKSQNLYDFEVTDSQGQTASLKPYKDQVVLIVNVASQCGFTPQYEGLEQLYRAYNPQGFSVLAFPCNQFGSQEPGTDSDIQKFCRDKYGVTFPVFSKVNVNGGATAPVYAWLKKSAPGLLGLGIIKWNFTKFLVGKDGKVIQRYAPNVEPEKIQKDIEKALAI